MNKKAELTPGEQKSSLKVAVICGILLFLMGILMAWFIFDVSYISIFWPGLIIGFCFTLFLPYSAIKASKQKTSGATPAKSGGQSWGGLGAGLGILILSLFHGNELLMINISAAATSLLLGIGFFSVALAFWKRNKEVNDPKR